MEGKLFSILAMLDQPSPVLPRLPLYIFEWDFLAKCGHKERAKIQAMNAASKFSLLPGG